MKTYHIKKLIDGYKLKPEFKDKTLVCCKAGKGYTHLQFGSDLMKLPSDPLCSLVFKDKYGRGDYTLSYYEWHPVKQADLFLV